MQAPSRAWGHCLRIRSQVEIYRRLVRLNMFPGTKCPHDGCWCRMGGGWHDSDGVCAGTLVITKCGHRTSVSRSVTEWCIVTRNTTSRDQPHWPQPQTGAGQEWGVWSGVSAEVVIFAMTDDLLPSHHHGHTPPRPRPARSHLPPLYLGSCRNLHDHYSRGHHHQHDQVIKCNRRALSSLTIPARRLYLYIVKLRQR